MKINSSRKVVEEILSRADVQIDGSRPWDIQVKNYLFYKKILRAGLMGLGESYVDGWWECESIDEMVVKLIRARLLENLKKDLKVIFLALTAKIFNEGRRSKSSEIVKRHYDLGNEFFECMLDKRMTYSCAFWDGARTLDEAQEAKLELVCQKIGLKPGMKVLDIGCGWGSFLQYAAEKYGIEGMGLTISPEQFKYAQKACAGLPVEIRLQDYRDLKGDFDRIVAIEVMEHVGYKNYRQFMKKVSQCLREDGLFFLHTMGFNRSTISGLEQEPWLFRYIAPNCMVPSLKQISDSVEGLFVIEDVHNIGAHYDKTGMAWYENLTRNWSKIKSKYDERFYRMWKYCWLIGAGCCRARHVQAWQIVLTKNGLLGGYNALRDRLQK